MKKKRVIHFMYVVLHNYIHFLNLNSICNIIQYNNIRKQIRYIDVRG